MAVVSAISASSQLLLVASSWLGAVVFVMAAMRVRKLESVQLLASRRVLAFLLWGSATAFVLRVATMFVISRPARYADYMPEDGNPILHSTLVQSIAANTSFFYIFSLTLLLGLTLSSVIAISLQKEKSAVA